MTYQKIKKKGVIESYQSFVSISIDQCIYKRVNLFLVCANLLVLADPVELNN